MPFNVNSTFDASVQFLIVRYNKLLIIIHVIYKQLNYYYYYSSKELYR